MSIDQTCDGETGSPSALAGLKEVSSSINSKRLGDLLFHDLQFTAYACGDVTHIFLERLKALEFRIA